MLIFRLMSGGVSAIVAACLCASPSLAQEAGATKVKNIVLVHGAFADGTSWSKLIPLLEARGYHVVAVQNPLTSLADGVAQSSRRWAMTRKLQVSFMSRPTLRMSANRPMMQAARSA